MTSNMHNLSVPVVEALVDDKPTGTWTMVAKDGTGSTVCMFFPSPGELRAFLEAAIGGLP